jgi:cytochrome P450
MSAEVENDEIEYTDLFLEMTVDPAAPWERYQALVEKGVVDAGGGKVLLASRAAVEAACRNPKVFAIDEAGLFMGNVRSFKPQGIDPPLQTKYRKILDPLFSPKRMDLLEDDVAARVNHFIDAFVERGECNFTEEFAIPFPSSVFLDLMGLPYEDIDLLLRFKDDILRPGITEGQLLTDPQERLQFQLKTGQEIYAYYEALLDERQKSPQDDILTHLLEAEIDGDRLTREDILDVCFHFLLAGLDTVTDNLTCFFAFLVQHPDYRLQLVENPSIIPSAVEELLRWESVVPAGMRRAKEDVELLGCPIKAGTAISLGWAPSNFDPAQFPDPLQVQFDRQPNRHFAFGAGVHRCLGSHLARRELRVTLREWHRRIPEYSLKPGSEVEYQTLMRSVENLMLVWPTS